MKSKVAFLEKLNHPLAIDYVNLPAIGVGQVLVKVFKSSICGAQIGEIEGAKGEDKFLPHLLGHEGGGIVKEIGLGVKNVKVDDHVVMHWRPGVGIQSSFPVYYILDKKIGGGLVTTFNEYSVVSENRLTKIDDSIPFDVAALMGCSITTGLGLINNEAQLKIGQSIVVLGCGNVGSSVIIGASMVSANPIIAVDIYQEKLDLAGKLGADHLIKFKTNSHTDPNDNKHIFDFDFDTLLEQILDLTGGGADVVVECSGTSSMIDIGYCMTAPGGRMILVGQTDWYKDVLFHQFRRHYTGKIILDSQGGLTNPTKDIPRYCNLFREGKLNILPLITHRFFDLEHINEALTGVKTGKTGKVMLEISPC